MKLQCGYIPGTQSMCYHPIKNIKFFGSNWLTCTVIIHGKIITVIKNENVPVIIKQQYQNNTYVLELTVNNKSVYSQQYLFHVDLEFTGTPEYEMINDMIVDH